MCPATLQFQHSEGQLVNLLRVAVEPSLDQGTRQAAAISFKNLVRRDWVSGATALALVVLGIVHFYQERTLQYQQALVLLQKSWSTHPAAKSLSLFQSRPTSTPQMP